MSEICNSEKIITWSKPKQYRFIALRCKIRHILSLDSPLCLLKSHNYTLVMCLKESYCLKTSVNQINNKSGAKF